MSSYPLAYADAFAAGLAMNTQAALLTGGPEFQRLKDRNGSGPFPQPLNLVGNGGGQISAGGLQLRSAIGQPLVGVVENGITLSSGYIVGAGAPLSGGLDFFSYLPLAVK